MVKEYSFSKAERLLSSKDFSRVVKGGLRCSSRNFIVYVLENSLNRHRLGIAVSARVANGPGRVRLKRLLREFFRLNKKRLLSLSSDSNNKASHIQQRCRGVDLVISVKRGAGKTASSGSLHKTEQELLQLFDKKLTERIFLLPDTVGKEAKENVTQQSR